MISRVFWGGGIDQWTELGVEDLFDDLFPGI